jgi:hypothetical protein
MAESGTTGKLYKSEIWEHEKWTLARREEYTLRVTENEDLRVFVWKEAEENYVFHNSIINIFHQIGGRKIVFLMIRALPVRKADNLTLIYQTIF